MKKARLEVLKKEFPFLRELLNEVGFDPSIGHIKIARIDSSFLISIPTSYYWSGVAGRHTVTKRLFAVEGGEVREIPLIPLIYEEECEIAGGYFRYLRGGQSILSSLIEAECLKPDFLVFCSSERDTYTGDQDSDIVTIYKPMKGATISQIWAKALRKAGQKIK